MELEVEITRLGAQGDGVAQGPDGPIFVPFTLPGERVRIEVEKGSDHAGLLEVLAASPDRIAPICPYFGACGGCALQHMEQGAYLRWKREQVVAALMSRGLDTEVEEVRPVAPGTRRWAGLTLGPVLAPTTSSMLRSTPCCPRPSRRACQSSKGALAPLLGGKREAKITVTQTPEGLDIVAEGVSPMAAAFGAFAGKAAALGVARLTVDGESIALGAAPTVTLGDAALRLPPGAFLQASHEAEAVLVDLMREGVAGAKRIADLFAGLGTFTLALAGKAAIDAFETDEAALSALAEAARRTPKLKPVRIFTRDLFRSPLGARSFKATTRPCSTRRAPEPPPKPQSSPSPVCRNWSRSPAIRAPWRAISASSSMAATALPASCP
jgi:23S rRNA (uracil1939-C5)-methyltransferase